MTKRTALKISDTIINELHRFPERKEAAAMLREQHAEIARLTGEIESASRRAEFWKAEHLAGNKEIARLQSIIDSRPAMNAGIAEAYVAWSAGIYKSEIARADRIDS